MKSGSRLSRALTIDDELVSPSARFTAGTEFVVGASVGYGRFQARAGVEAERVVEAVLDEVARMASDPPDADEVDRARALFAVDWLEQLGSITARADNLSRIAQLVGDPREIDHELDGILAVTADEVAAAAQELLAADATLVLSYVPEVAA